MRKLFVIGIGAGDPEHVTVQAIKALNAVDVFFLIDKGAEKALLARLRTEICERYIEHRDYRIVAVPDAARERAAPAYRSAVSRWRSERAERLERAISEELDEDGCGALLVSGDPSLYDSALAVLQEIAARAKVAFRCEVIPGITSVQALAARHQIALSRVGGEVRITTGRRLREGLAAEDEDVVVMLDGDCSFATLAAEEIDIYWGADIGTRQEILISGRLADVADEIARVRKRARERKGWIMDTYLLRRPRS